MFTNVWSNLVTIYIPIYTICMHNKASIKITIFWLVHFCNVPKSAHIHKIAVQYLRMQYQQAGRVAEEQHSKQSD
jgi:hypothetical protein